MKKKSLCIIFAALIAISLSGCIIVNFGDGFSGRGVSGKGELESYKIDVGAFNSLRIEGYCDIKYYNDPSYEVTFAVQPNLREYFVLEVKNGELIVRTTRMIRAGRGKTPVLTISVPELISVTIQGAGTFTAHDTINTDTFTLNISGAGNCYANLAVNKVYVEMSGACDLDLSGSAETAHFRLSGAGDLDALKMETREVRIELAGAGNVKVYCTEHLFISASGAGDIEYRGSPRIDMSKSGVVTIRQISR